MNRNRRIIVTSQLAPLTACGFALQPRRGNRGPQSRRDHEDGQFTVPVRPGQIVHDQNGDEVGNLVSLLVDESTEHVVSGVIAMNSARGRDRSIVAPWNAFDVMLADPAECFVVMRRVVATPGNTLRP